MAEARSYLLDAYRVATRVAPPLAGPLLAWRTRRGKEDPSRRGERLGVAGFARPGGPLVWLHAASVGETVSVLPLAERIVSSGRANCLLTTGTVTSAQVVSARQSPRLLHQYVPLDTPRFVRSFLKHWRPGLAVFAESELWPNMIVETAASGAGLALVNGRMSARSHLRWQRRGSAMIRQLLSRFDLCLAQSEGDAERLAALGASQVLCTGNLKFDVPGPPVDKAERVMLAAAIGGRPCWAAASTHPGEEDAVRAAHAALAAGHPALLTILAPRHPERGAEIAATLGAAGIKVSRRTADRTPQADTDIFVMDTIGELGLVFDLADIAFMGGSFVPHGGQNPIEPARLGAAVLHGPHVANFSDIYGALDAAGAAEVVSGGEELAAAIGRLLADPRQARRRTEIAVGVLKTFSGALDRTMDALEPLLRRAAAPQENA